jgi:hypothetical protein
VFTSSTLIEGEPRRIEVGIAFVRHVAQPTVTGLPGSVGLSMWVDRDRGGCLISTGWGTRAAMRASDAVLAPVRAEAGRVLGGTPVTEEWELAHLHRLRRATPGCWIRSTAIEFVPADLERVLDTYRRLTVPAMEALNGFCSAALVIDRPGSRGVSTVTFESLETLTASRARADDIRQAAVDEAHVQVERVTEMEQVIAGLHIPDAADQPAAPAM